MTYPRYHLSAFTKRGATNYHTKRKKSFLIRLDRLRKLETLKYFTFSVEYFKQGFNKSIKYTKDQFDEAAKVARIFSSPSEIKSCKN
jgi:hypothetical protein